MKDFLKFILFVIALLALCFSLTIGVINCGIEMSEGSVIISQDLLDWLYKQPRSEDQKKPELLKTVMRYINTHETVWAVTVIDDELKTIAFTFGDELECVEKTLNDPYVQIVLADGMYAIDKKYLSDEPAPKFKIEKDAGIFQLTAYAATGNRCANGKWPRINRTVAAHKKQFPLGTRLYIEGYGYFIVEDRGGFPMGVIDIYLHDHKKCVKFGRRKAHVYVIEWGDNRRYKPEPSH